MAKASWKRYAASVTSFGRNYRDDLFFRTELRIIGLQVAFGVFILTLVTVAYGYLYRDITSGLIEGIRQSLLNGDAAGGIAISDNLEYLKTRSLVVVGAFVLGGTFVFGYLIANLSLSPTRRALDSQKQFIGNIAHELRTPLAVAKTNAEVALLDATADLGTLERFGTIVGELDRMSEILNNLLSLSASTRAGGIEFSDVDLGTVVDRAVAHLADLAQRKDLALTVKKSEYRTVWGNAAALEQIVMNLVKNALAYTRAGGDGVSVSFEPDHQGHLALTVQDSGIGIPQSELFRIFEPFYRGDVSRTRGNSSGSGLGLSIVNELVKLHRGRIAIRSAPKRGTVVRILLPVGRNAQRDEHAEEGEFGEIAVDFEKRQPFM